MRRSGCGRGRPPPRGPRPIALAGPGVVVMEHRGRNFLLTLRDGRTSPLLATRRPTEVVAVSSGKVYFREHLAGRWSHYRTTTRPFDVTTGVKGATFAKGLPARDRLYVLDASKPQAARRLTDVPIDVILSEDDGHFWVIPAGKGRQLCRISKAGGLEEIVPLDDRWVAALTQCTFSPDRQHLCLTFAHEQHDFHRERGLVVVDLEKKAIVLARRRVTDLFPTWGNPAFLAVRWLNDDLLEFGFSNTEVVDVTSGEPAEPADVKAFGKWQFPPSNPDTRTVGHFDLAHGEAYFKGDDTPVASVLNEGGVVVQDLAVDEQGNWAAYVSPEVHHTYLIDGKAKRKRRLMPGWSYDIQWVGASKRFEAEEP